MQKSSTSQLLFNLMVVSLLSSILISLKKLFDKLIGWYEKKNLDILIALQLTDQTKEFVKDRNFS